MEGETRRVLKWFPGKFPLPRREVGVLEEEATLLEKRLTQERHWVPEEMREVVTAMEAIGEDAMQRRDRDREERSRDPHRVENTEREQPNQLTRHMYR